MTLTGFAALRNVPRAPLRKMLSAAQSVRPPCSRSRSRSLTRATRFDIRSKVHVPLKPLIFLLFCATKPHHPLFPPPRSPAAPPEGGEGIEFVFVSGPASRPRCTLSSCLCRRRRRPRGRRASGARENCLTLSDRCGSVGIGLDSRARPDLSYSRFVARLTRLRAGPSKPPGPVV